MQLVLRPSPEFLADPEVELPIVIDPAATLYTSADTHVQSNSTVSKWNDVELKSGTYDAGTTRARSLLKFNVSSLTGKYIVSADLYLWEFHSWSCSAREVRVHRAAAPFSSSTIWSNQPGTGAMAGSANVAKGYSSSCPAGWVPITITGLVRQWVDGTYPNNGVRVMAADESDTYGWKKFNSADASSNKPYLAVTYNSYPNVPTGMSPAHNAIVNSAKPTLSAVFTDPDGGTGTLVFEIINDAYQLVASGSKSGVASGTSGSWQPSVDLPDDWYFWRVRGGDGINPGPWSGYHGIKVDTTAPAAPTVSSSTHASQTTWYVSDDPAFSWTASDSSGINGYSYVLDQSSSTTPDTTSEGTGTTKSYSNLADGVHWFHIRARDGAGNWGATRHYKVQIDDTAPGAPTVSSSTHPVQATWYANDDPVFSWTASDTSGINGYSYVLDQSSSTTPDTTSEGTGTTKSYSNLADGEHWFHIRARNSAGLWGATRHYKVLIDDTAPATPTVVSSTHPNQSHWYTPADGASFNDPTFSWAGLSDVSGITGYSYVLDQISDTTPDTTSEGTGTSTSYTDVGGGGSGVFWFHVRARNGSGMWGSTQHYKLQVDTGTATFVEPGNETTLQGTVTLRATTGPNAIGMDFDLWNGASWTTVGSGTQSPAGTWSYNWATAALDGSGDRIHPNGPYQLRATPQYSGGPGPAVTGPVVVVDDARLGMTPWWTFADLAADAQVNVATGNVIISGNDVALPTAQGDIAFTRTYNSQGAALDGPLGWGWAMAMPVDGAPAAFTTLTHHDDDGDYVEVLDVSGEALYFLSDGSGGWLPEAGAEGVTLALASGVWTLTDIDETAYKFTDAGPGDPSLLTEAVPSSGPGVSYTYDGQDRLIEVTDPTGYKSFVLEYGTNGKLARIKAAFDANTVVAEYDYDINGHLIEVTDPRTGLSWQYGYTGHLITTITPPGQTPVLLSYLGSPTGRLQKATRAVPGGGTAEISLAYGTWDDGAEVTVNTARNHDWVYRFDGSSRTRFVEPPTGPTTETRWNEQNQSTYTQTTAEAVAGMATTFVYSSDTDQCNYSGVTGANDGTDLCSETKPEHGTTSYRYDEGLGAVHHLVTRQINANGSYVVFEYDSDGLTANQPNREKTYTASDVLVQTRQWTYDSWGRTLTETSPAGKETTFAYYSSGDTVRGGLLQSLSRTGTPTRSFDYNVWGSQTSEVWPLGATVATFDSAQRPVTSTAPGEPTVTTTYHSATGLVATIGDSTGTVSYGYDAWGRVTSYTDAGGATSTSVYDVESNLLSVTTPVGVTSYTYDALGRVVEVDDPSGVTGITYRTDGTYETVDLPNGITATYTARTGVGDIETITYENTAGLLGVFERSYDVLGRVTTDVTPNGTRSYTYDGIGRLVEVEDRDLSDVVVETREYTFDADTNRTALTTTPAVGSPTTVT